MFFKSLLVFFVVYFLSDFSHGQRDKKFFRKDYTYLESVKGFYKFHTTLRTWPESIHVCALEGASLYYPESSEEAHAVLSLWNRTAPKAAWVYIGITDLMTEGVFETIDGRLVSELYTSWKTSQPDNSGGVENCGCLNFNDMHDCKCNLKVASICKKSLESLEWNYQCNMPYTDYTYNGFSKCYKLHTTPMNWNEAYAVCRQEQAYLAEISNQLEADFLANFTVFATKQRVVGNYYRGLYHVGFHNKLHGGWQTVKGEPMNVDNESWWDNHQPIIDEQVQCGSMFFNGRLATINCDTKSFFICEHDANNTKLNEARQ